ncbi:sigma-70 family RNA polymerase sigma factor [Paenibacillus wulumuqiensis]|uniref:sigma-70 family RNA polymerase sigma factor n=1 Tax=Paenibacillus wulumuqiensis TaxID=1567107 RepID=UPI0006971E90|nr:sigma-70 family RNA polymerase sigma factor [Paenibacillus wulumuqiensis]
MNHSMEPNHISQPASLLHTKPENPSTSPISIAPEVLESPESDTPHAHSVHPEHTATVYSLDGIYSMYYSRLLAVTYRMTGTMTDAEDIVQDLFVYLSQRQEELPRIEHMQAYLIRAVTNRSINLLQSARKKRELYTGPWLPEPSLQSASSRRSRSAGSGSNHDNDHLQCSLHPVVDQMPSSSTADSDAEQLMLRQEELSYAVMVLLDQLSPVERVIFVLRESLGYDYCEIAGYVDKSEAACRKILSRVHARLEPAAVSSAVASQQGESLVLAFLAAAREGDLQPLLERLQEDVRLYTDGGGKVRAALRPILTRSRVTAFFHGIASKGSLDGQWSMVWINGEPGLQLQRDGRTVYVCALQWDSSGQIQNVYMVSNPDKLREPV